MKIKKLLLLTLLSISLLTGCIKRDNMEDIKIYVSTYPIEYIVDSLYGSNSTINSIYPNGINTNEYKPTNKQIKKYADSDMIVYNGLSSKEKAIAASLLNNNKDIKVIDVTKGISLKNDEEELWLSPSNYLMLAQNVKDELISYVTSTVVIKEIENKYENLKLTISKYDAELKLIAESSKSNIIIAGNNIFEFLEKYGYQVYNVEDDDELSFAKAKIQNKDAQYVFVLDTDAESEQVKALENLGAKKQVISGMKTLTEENRQNNITYQTIIEEFIDKIKEEVYN